MKARSHGGALKELAKLENVVWTRRSWPQRVVIIFILIILVVYMQAAAVASWYINKHKNEPLNIGVTFSTSYAQYLGLNPKKTFLALRDEMGIHRFRLVTFWNDVEPSHGHYDFSNLDWQLNYIKQVNGTASVAIGMRQPRWPECHIPTWADKLSASQRNRDVDKYIAATIKHLRHNSSVVSYQLENEYFLGAFGQCPAPSRPQLVDEFNLVKQLDPNRPVIMTLSNNYFGIPTGQPRPDEFGVSVYKRVFDFTVTHRYLEYPFTPTYYAYRAGLTEIFTGRESMLHELQVEPWVPPKFDLRTMPVSEMYKSMNPKLAQQRIQYGIDTGFRDIDLWGGEWWYYLKTVRHNPDIWNAVKTSLTKVEAGNTN